MRAVKDNGTNGGRTKIDISWPRTYSHDPTPDVTDPDDRAYATEYRIQWSTNPDASDWNLLDQDGADPHNDFTAEQANCPSAGDENTCTISHDGLTAGTKYSYRVFAMNAVAGDANVVNTVFSWWQIGAATTSQAEVPGRPISVTANQSISNGHTEIDLVWNPPTNDHDGGGDGDGYGVIIEYDIEKSDDGGTSWSALATVTPAKNCTPGGTGATHKLSGVGPVTMCEYTHEELAPGQTVRYRMGTVNVGPRERMSDWSDTATQTTEQSTKPDKPEGLVAEAAGRSMINLMWNIQSRTPPAAPILAYIIEYMMGEEWVQVARITDADSADNPNDVVRTIHTDTGLAPETDRTYRVRAQNEPALGTMDVSEESEHASATTDAAMVPGMPTSVTATANSDTAITVSWTAPADPTSAPVTGYKVMWKMSSATDYAAADMATVAATATSYQVTGLTASTAYTFKVVATSADGYGLPADEAMEPTNELSPMLTAPTMVDATVSGNSVTVTWVDGENAARHAIILFTSDYEVGGRVISDPSNNSVLFSNLTAGTYIAVVVALDSAGDDFQDMAIGFDLATVPGS